MSTSPIRSATHRSRFDPGTREAHRARTMSSSPIAIALANFASPGEPNDGIERDQSLGKVAVIGGDAGIACAQHRVLAVEAFHCRAARTRHPLVAGPGGLAEIFAARSLQHVAGKARHVADLAACRQSQAIGDDWIAAFDFVMVGSFAHSHQGAEADTVIGNPDLPERWFTQPVEVQQPAGRRDT